MPAAGRRRRVTTAIISVETVLLVILLVLVAGLLRSHAEILRRLEDRPGAPGPARPRRRGHSDRRRPGAPGAPPIAGPTPDGDAISLDFAAARRRSRRCWPS